VKQLEETIRKTGKKFMVAFCFRYHEGLTLAKRFVDEGRIGRLVSARLRMSENLAEVRPDYKRLFTLKEGGVYDLTHEIDLAFWFCGTQLKRLQRMDGVMSDLGFTAPDIASLSMVLRIERCSDLSRLLFPVRGGANRTDGHRRTITVSLPAGTRAQSFCTETRRRNGRNSILLPRGIRC
jgi:predicted dehydrogenase